MSIAANQNTTLPALFEAHLIRRVFHDNEWHFSIVDVIAALTDSPNPSDYLSKLRRRDPEIRKGEGQFVHPLCVATAGGTQKVKCAPAEWIFRLIQSIPSPRAEPFKLWLSQVGAERIREEANPDLIADRTIKRELSHLRWARRSGEIIGRRRAGSAPIQMLSGPAAT